MHRLSVTGNQLNIFIADYTTVWELHTHTFIMVSLKSSVAINIDRVVCVKYHAFCRQCINSFAIVRPNLIARSHMKGLNPWGFQLQMQCDRQEEVFFGYATKAAFLYPDKICFVPSRLYFWNRLSTTMLILHYHSLVTLQEFMKQLLNFEILAPHSQDPTSSYALLVVLRFT